jgi:Mg-chelatase subunit ChlD
MESCLALALALEGIPGVNPAITRFPYDNNEGVVPLLKHGQRVRSNVSNFAPVATGYTPLHDAMWYAASAVIATREQRKVIMILTDGQPDEVFATKAIISRCEESGIDVIGVGIGFDTSHLFSTSILINDVSDLRSELFKISRDLLLAA